MPVKIAITIKGDKLFGQPKGQPVFPLEATAANVFKFEQAALILAFDVNKKQMTLKQGGQAFLFTKEQIAPCNGPTFKRSLKKLTCPERTKSKKLFLHSMNVNYSKDNL